MRSFKQSIISSIRDDRPNNTLAGHSQVEDTLPGTGTQAGRYARGASLSPNRGSALSYHPSSRHESPRPSNLGRSSPARREPSGGYVDGKDFFRVARQRLSYDEFNRFLASIKLLNDHTQSRDVTLEQARRIFGAENHDLYEDFRSLLAHHGLV